MQFLKDMHKNASILVDSELDALLSSNINDDLNKMESRSKIRTIIVFCLFLAIAGIIGFGYFCQDQVSLHTNYMFIIYL